MKSKIKMVPEWKKAWQWASVQCMVVAAAIQGAWMFIPDDLRGSIPPNVVRGITIALLAAGVFGRVTTKKKG